MDILAAAVVAPPRPRRMSLAWFLCSWVTPELESGAVLATSGRPSDMRATKVSRGGIVLFFTSVRLFVLVVYICSAASSLSSSVVFTGGNDK